MVTPGIWQLWLIPLAIVISVIYHRLYLKDELAPKNINNGWYIISLITAWYFLQCVYIIVIDAFVIIRGLVMWG